MARHNPEFCDVCGYPIMGDDQEFCFNCGSDIIPIDEDAPPVEGQYFMDIEIADDEEEEPE